MIHCRVVTPEGLAKEMDTTILNVVSTVGQLGILSRHVPLVTPLAISRIAQSLSAQQTTALSQ